MGSAKRISSSFLISIMILSLAVVAGFHFSKVDASFTGRIFDEGIDNDDDGLFERLQIAMEFSITSPGVYSIYASGLTDNITYPQSYVSVGDSIQLELSVALQNVTLSFYGPTIRQYGYVGLRFVNYISVNFHGSYVGWNDVALSRSYSYSEFDSAFTDMEAVFRVFPNGTVDMGGLVNATMAYPWFSGKIDLDASIGISTQGSQTTVLANQNLTLPSWAAALWPFDGSKVSIMAQYAEQTGLLNFGLNSTVEAAPDDPYTYYPYYSYPYYSYPWYCGSLYPLNSSDFSLDLSYSNGVASGELDASTVLPADAILTFPFNATDFSLSADFLAGLLKGNITFHILPGFPLGDLGLDFEATSDQATATGSINVIYSNYSGMVVDEPFVDQQIANFTALEGTGPDSLFNITKGLLELDPSSSITKTPLFTPPGCKLDFSFLLDGDFVSFVAYMMSGSTVEDINYRGLYRLLNSTAQSFNSASLQLSYVRASQTAVMKLIFNDDVEELLTNIFTFPADTKPLLVVSDSMRPTLEAGDIVVVKNTTTAEIIVGPGPYSDIIAFTSPSDPTVIVTHRAINQTLWNGTTYFQTTGDYYGLDYWTGPGTHEGMVCEDLVFGKVVERIPFVGSIFVSAFRSLFGYSAYPQIQDVPQIVKDLLPLLETLSLHLTYAETSNTFEFNLGFVFDAAGFRDRIMPEIPNMVPAELKTFVAGLLTNVYANVTSAEVSLTYQQGKEELKSAFTVEGDFSREINHIKNLYINEIAEHTTPGSFEQALFINSTRLEIHNMNALFDVTGDSLLLAFDGFRTTPPIDPIDQTSFNLYRFFNLTAPTSTYYRENPVNNEKLKLTVQGGCNGTHIVTLACPPTMPPPDTVSEDKTLMVWNNQSISGLKDLIFSLQYYSEISANGHIYPVITNSNGTVSSVTFDGLSLSLTIDGPHGEMGYANISIPRGLMYTDPTTWTITAGSTVIVYPNYNVTETANCTYLYFNFAYGSIIHIQITIIPEFATNLLLLIIPTIIAVAIAKTELKARRRYSSHYLSSK